MASLDEQHVTTATLRAEGTITKGYGLKMGSAQNGALVSSVNGSAIAGVAGESCASGEAFLVIKDGVTKAIAGDAITLHAEVAVDSDARFIEAASGDVIVGIARSAAGADGDEFLLEFVRGLFPKA
jgi:hypothetical protein